PEEDPRCAGLIDRQGALLQEHLPDWQLFTQDWQADRVTGPLQDPSRPELLPLEVLLEVLETRGPFWSFQRGFPLLYVSLAALPSVGPVLSALGPAVLVHC